MEHYTLFGHSNETSSEFYMTKNITLSGWILVRLVLSNILGRCIIFSRIMTRSRWGYTRDPMIAHIFALALVVILNFEILNVVTDPHIIIYIIFWLCLFEEAFLVVASLFLAFGVFQYFHGVNEITL